MNAPPPPLAPRLLLVEDEFLIRMTLSEALADDGFEVVEAEEADAALARLRDPGGFALMLTDIQLPGRLDGVALARQARISQPNLPVIFMSGRPEIGLEPNPLDTFVGKPYSPTALSATVRRILNGG